MAPRIPVPSFALRGLKPGSLSRALTLRLALAVLILTSMVAGGAAWISISQERRGLEQEAHALVQNLITSLTTPVWELDEKGIHAICDGLFQDDRVAAVMVTEPDGHRLYGRSRQEGKAITASGPILYGGRELGRVSVTLSTQGLEELAARQSRGALLLLGASLLGLLLLTGFFLERIIRRPLQALSEAMDRMARGEYDKAPEEGPSELSPLIRRFKDMAREVGRREAQLKALLDSITETALLMDPQGRILALNEVAGRRFGKPPEELLGKNLFELLPPAGATRRREALNRLLSEKSPVQVLDTRDGRTYDARWYPVLDPNGEVTQVAIYAVDITERRQREQDRMRAEKLESIGVLAGGIAHDFNNLLTVIHGYLELSLPQAPPGTEIRENLEIAREACLKGKDLTRQFLTFAQGGAPKIQAVDLEGLLTQATTLALAGSGIESRFQIPQDLWAVSCDPDQIRDVVTIVLSNARDAMPGGGMVEIGAENITADPPEPLSPHTPFVHVWIRDRGTGIPEDHLPKLFDPYFSTKERGARKGMGLSLATAYSIMQRHGGAIRISSRVGEGTTVHLFLKAHSQKEAPTGKPPAQPREEREAAGRILVMDDEEMLRHLATEMLRRDGWEVVTASDGQEAVTLYARARKEGRPFEVVVLDLTVKGGMGGKEAMEELLRLDPSVRALVASGYSDDPVLMMPDAYGFKGAVPKPYTMEELTRAVRAVVENPPGDPSGS